MPRSPKRNPPPGASSRATICAAARRLLRVFVLVDGRHGLKESDHETMRAARRRRRLLRGRADQGRRSEGGRPRRADRGDARGLAQARRRLIPRSIFTSARTGEGVARIARPYREAPRRAGRAAAGLTLAPWPLRWSLDEEPLQCLRRRRRRPDRGAQRRHFRLCGDGAGARFPLARAGRHPLGG